MGPTLPGNFEGGPPQDAGEGLLVARFADAAFLCCSLELRDALHLLRCGYGGEVLGQKVVAGEAVLDFLDLPGVGHVYDVFQKQYAHGRTPLLA